MSRKNRGFPLEYYPGEILTEREAVINRKMFLFRVTGMGEQCYVVKHDHTRIFLAFKVDSRESYTGYQLNPDQS